MIFIFMQEVGINNLIKRTFNSLKMLEHFKYQGVLVETPMANLMINIGEPKY